MGCWTPVQSFTLAGNADWSASLLAADGSRFEVRDPGGAKAQITWDFLGRHNVENALAALAAARHVGVSLAQAAQAVCQFRGVKRRLELLGEVAGVAVYDDFAHHPTAIATTLQGLRASTAGRLIAVVEPRSNTMRIGQHRDALVQCTRDADKVFWFQPPGMEWSLEAVVAASAVPAVISNDVRDLAQQVAKEARPGDRVVIMSNGGFGGIHQILLDELTAVNS